MLKVRCQANATLDPKGRLALPAPLKRALGESDVSQLVLAFHKGAVWGMTPQDFEEQVERRLEQQDPFAADVLDFAHAMLSTAQDVKVDNNGRILLPPILRKLAGLDREIVVSSLLSRVEIWDAQAWEQRFQVALERAGAANGMPRGEAW